MNKLTFGSYLLGLVTLGLTSVIHGDIKDPYTGQMRSCYKYSRTQNRFYLQLGSGASFANEANVIAPTTIWDPAIQGYDSSLGTKPIIEGGLGYQICSFINADVTFSYRPDFQYRKFQTSFPNGITPGFLGDTKTREFNLDVSSALFSFSLSGYGLKYLRYRFYDNSSIYPVFGAGVGMSRLTIYNFRTTGLPSVDPSVNPAPAFASSNDYTPRYKFTWQASAALEYRYCNSWALSMGYRWFDAGHFDGPSYIRRAPGTALDIRGSEWNTSFSSQEATIQFKLFL